MPQIVTLSLRCLYLAYVDEQLQAIARSDICASDVLHAWTITICAVRCLAWLNGERLGLSCCVTGMEDLSGLEHLVTTFAMM